MSKWHFSVDKKRKATPMHKLLTNNIILRICLFIALIALHVTLLSMFILILYNRGWEKCREYICSFILGFIERGETHVDMPTYLWQLTMALDWCVITISWYWPLVSYLIIKKLLFNYQSRHFVFFYNTSNREYIFVYGLSEVMFMNRDAYGIGRRE